MAWVHAIDQKSLQAQKLEHSLADWIDSIQSEYALDHGDLGLKQSKLFHAIDSYLCEREKRLPRPFNHAFGGGSEARSRAAKL